MSDQWLDALEASGKGGRTMVLPEITRGLDWSHTIEFPGDYSADTFAGSIAREPDGGASEEVDFAVGTLTYTDGFTQVPLSLTAAQTGAMTAPTADGVLLLYFEILRTPSGGSAQRDLGGLIYLAERVGN